MFAVSIAFVCFYHADRVLSAIAKFLVYLFREGRGGLKWERGEVGEESGDGTRRARKMQMHDKYSPKTQHIWHLGTHLGDYRPVS